ncbi:DNA repair protein RecO C-terminal domain-containing protein [Synergistaceae bacterium OttesenSCG-928-D05]|nr:DNA repair protein RecO C-terminal domain-containing protein [Synergistaceae bacterium OttesenSCG-928-D05]
MIQPYEQDKLQQGYYTNIGTVLLRRDSSREGQSLLLFLRDLGPRWVNAPGASGGKNRFGGATEPLIWAEFNLYQSPKSLTLQSAEVKEDFLSLRGQPEKLLTALRLYKHLPKMLIVGHESNNLLTLLWASLVCLKENCPPAAVEFRFFWRVLQEQGLAPSLLTCSECGTKLENGAAWTPDGLKCTKCAATADIDAETLLILRRAALLKHEQYLQWTDAKNYSAIFKEASKKLLSFFANFN